MAQEFIDIANVMPERLPSGKEIRWKEVGDKTEIYCDRYGVRGGQPSPVRINRHIPLCDLLFEGLGLWAGDGIKRTYDFTTFGFGNSCLELHKHFLRFARILGLEAKDFKARVSLPLNSQYSIEEFENYIKKELGIRKFFKGNINDTRNYDYLDIIIRSRLLSFVTKHLHDYLIRDLTDKKFIAAYLRGVIASEGNVHLRRERNNQLGEINIGAEDDVERAAYKKLLEKLDIQPNRDRTIEGQKSILIHGRTNFLKVAEYKLCDLHPKKRKDFWEGLRNYKSFQFRKGEGNRLVLESLLMGEKSASQLTKELNISIGTVKTDHLWGLIKKDFVRYTETRKVGKWWTKFYRITDEGKKFLESKLKIPL